MNWLLFILATGLILAIEVMLRPLLGLPGRGGISPELTLVLATWLALVARSSAVPWAMLALGLLAELSSPGPLPGVVVGPVTLGYLAAGYVVLQLRVLVFRESLITLIAMVFAAGLAVQLVSVALLIPHARGWVGEAGAGWSASGQLTRGFLELLYTAAATLPLGLILVRTIPLWHFAGKSRM
ncbi:MAG: hypothetical protein ACLFV3_08850 [Phycisphaeraceae bacterium]